MNPTAIRGLGLAVTAAYATFAVWLFAAQPRTFTEVAGGVAAGVGAYRIDRQSFEEALRFFRDERFVEARSAFGRADPAQRDPTTQFYVGYSFYRQGWGRLYHDDRLFRHGLEAVDRAIALAPDRRIIVDDPDLGMRSADELKAELQRGLTREASDLNPLRVFRERK